LFTVIFTPIIIGTTDYLFFRGIMRRVIIAVGIILVMLLISGCLGYQVVPIATPSPTVAPSINQQSNYPPVEKYYDSRNVDIGVSIINSNTIKITNNGGPDGSSLLKIWVNVNNRGYIQPYSGLVSSKVGSSAFYSASFGSFVTITGEFTDCNAVLWNNMIATPAPSEIIRPSVKPTMMLTPTQQPDSDIIQRKYEWDYDFGDYYIELNIPESLYDYFHDLPHNKVSNYAKYAMSSYDKPYLEKLAGDIKNFTEDQGFSNDQTVLFTIAFVQSLPYTSDKVTTGYDEYPRYPVETLVDYGGDCEDTAILAAALVNELGYGVVLLKFEGTGGNPGHMAIGIKGSDNIQGTYYSNEGYRYYYLETTGSGWRIGQVPDEYKGTQAYIYPIY
jgi:hypothetical protein